MRKSRDLLERFDRQLAKYTPDSIAGLCLHNLRRTEADWAGAARAGLVAHELLYLLRSVSGVPSTAGQRDIGWGEFARLVNTLKRMSNALSLQSDQGLLESLRLIGRQQFWLQRRLELRDLGRVWSLFSASEARPLDAAFAAANGYSLLDHIQFTVFVWSWMQSRGEELDFLAGTIFGATRVPTAEQGAFLSYVASGRGQFASFAVTRPGAIRSRLLQLWEPSPFIERPILRNTGPSGYHYIPVSVGVVAEHLRRSPFAAARSLGMSDRIVGGVFERYIGEVLKTGALGDVQGDGHAKAGDKNADFVVSLGQGAELVVECKASELRGFGALNQSPEALAKALRTSVVKGLVQIMTRARDTGAGVETFGLLVTPWQMDLGVVQEIWEHGIGRRVRSKLGVETDAGLPMPIQRIWIVSASELERLVEWSLATEDTIHGFLRTASDGDTRLSSRKRMFGMWIPNNGAKMLPMLEMAAEDLFECARECFSKR